MVIDILILGCVTIPRSLEAEKLHEFDIGNQ